VDFPAPAEPCATERDLEIVDDALPDEHDDVLHRLTYTTIYCLEGDERLR
jgi:hypothetical protein